MQAYYSGFLLWRTWAVLNGGVVLQPSKPSTRNVRDRPSIIPLLARRRLVEMAIGTVSTSGELRALLGECPFSGGRLSDRNTLTDAFAGFVRQTGPGLKHALMAALGAEVGMEAASEAMAYGWEHWDRVGRMENPGGYLYRVGRNWGRRRLRTHRIPQRRRLGSEPAQPEEKPEKQEQWRPLLTHLYRSDRCRS